MNYVYVSMNYGYMHMNVVTTVGKALGTPGAELVSCLVWV